MITDAFLIFDHLITRFERRMRRMNQALTDLVAAVEAITTAVQAATAALDAARTASNDPAVADAAAKIKAQADALNAAVTPPPAP